MQIVSDASDRAAHGMRLDVPGFEVAPWELRWRHADPSSLGLTESTFALSNGHIGLRGTLEEGEPVVQPGTYLNGFYELRDLPYAERGYGYPESGPTVVNVTVFTDLYDLHDNVSSGVHIAALAGAWVDCVAGFGGMRDYGGQITLAPRLPSKLSYLSFRMVIRNSKIVIAIDGDKVTYRLLTGEPIELSHHGHSFLLAQQPVTMAIPKIALRTPPAQPKGREPYRRVIME